MSALESTGLCVVCAQIQPVPKSSPCPYYRLVHCAVCGHVRVAEQDIEAETNTSIQLEYFDESFAKRSGFFVGLYERINCQRAFRMLKLRSGARILEVGPGSGSVMAYFSRRGCEVLGLDLSPAVAAQIKARYGFRVITRTLDEHSAEGGANQYDGIVMRHVVEHLLNPIDALRSVHTLLCPGGKLYVAVPNMDSWHRFWRGWSGYEPYHVHYFGACSLSAALRRSGFTVSAKGSYESLTGWSNTLLRSITKQEIGRTGDSSVARKASVVRTLFETMRLTVGLILTPLRWIQARIGRGEELFVVAVKAPP